MADVGNKIRKRIQDIANATNKEKTTELAANISKAPRAKDAQINSITAQVKLLTNAIALLMKSLANKENNGGGGNGGRRNGVDSGSCQGGQKLCFTRNMGSYCWSHGHHPVGTKHNSNTYTQKKDGHKDNATTTNCMGSSYFWSQANSVRPSQQDQASYKGKSDPR